MTSEDIRLRITAHLLENTSGALFWTSDEIDAMIQEGQEIQAEEVRLWRRSVYVPKSDGIQFYDLRRLAPDCMMPYRVWDQTAQQRLQPTTMHQLDQDRFRWLSTTGTQPFWWYPVSWGRFGVHPATAEGGGMLRVDYLAWPTALLDDDDEPEGSEAEQDALVLYGEYAGLMQQWEVARATERFGKFTAHWKDSRFRAEVARLQAREPQRQRG